MIAKGGNRFSDKIMRKNAMRVVIAGFGPFPGAPSNPSGRLAIALARRRRPALAGIEIASHIFATAYDAVDRGRDICIETRARNARSILFPDASGWHPERAVIEPSQRALTGSAPLPRLLNALRQTALPARLSRDAGAYLCNYAYWRALQCARGGRPLVQFVHIPWVDAKSRRASSPRSALSLSRLVAGAENLLIALVAASRQSNASPIAARPSSGSGRLRNRSNYASSARQNAPTPRTRSRRAANIAR